MNCNSKIFLIHSTYLVLTTIKYSVRWTAPLVQQEDGLPTAGHALTPCEPVSAACVMHLMSCLKKFPTHYNNTRYKNTVKTQHFILHLYNAGSLARLVASCVATDPQVPRLAQVKPGACPCPETFHQFQSLFQNPCLAWLYCTQY